MPEAKHKGEENWMAQTGSGRSQRTNVDGTASPLRTIYHGSAGRAGAPDAVCPSGKNRPMPVALRWVPTCSSLERVTMCFRCISTKSCTVKLWSSGRSTRRVFETILRFFSILRGRFSCRARSKVPERRVLGRDGRTDARSRRFTLASRDKDAYRDDFGHWRRRVEVRPRGNKRAMRVNTGNEASEAAPDD